jgi:hypothetical protein
MLRSSYATSGKLGFPIHIRVIDGDDEPQSSASPLHGQEYEGCDECGQDDEGADAHGGGIHLNFTGRNAGW